MTQALLALTAIVAALELGFIVRALVFGTPVPLSAISSIGAPNTARRLAKWHAWQLPDWIRQWLVEHHRCGRNASIEHCGFAFPGDCRWCETLCGPLAITVDRVDGSSVTVYS